MPSVICNYSFSAMIMKIRKCPSAEILKVMFISNGKQHSYLFIELKSWVCFEEAFSKSPDVGKDS